MKRAVFFVLAASLAVFLTFHAATIVSAHDCSSPGDCEQTSGYNSALAASGAVVAIATAILATGVGPSVSWSEKPPEVPQETQQPEPPPQPEVPPEAVVPPQPEPPPEQEAPPQSEPPPDEQTTPAVTNASPEFDDAAEGRMDAANAPELITLPSDLSSALDRAWQGSEADGLEHGGTLVKKDETSYASTNEGRGEDGVFPPDYSTREGETVKGAFHTHPYKGGENGIDFSAGDFRHFIEANNNVHGVQSGESQFMMVRTNATPKKLDWPKVAELWDNTNFDALQRGLSASEASKEAALKTANALNIKLYEGQGGQLTLKN